jgi:hypothetical protein
MPMNHTHVRGCCTEPDAPPCRAATGRHLCFAPLRTHATLLDLTRHGSILEDDVAYELLPESTRGFVSPAAVGAWSAFLPFCDWIKVGGVGRWSVSVVGGVRAATFQFKSTSAKPRAHTTHRVHVAFKCCAPRRRLDRLTVLA